ncbi:hypothetical protein D9C73_022444 [Collichthys lucidus]|uniref:Uncharacterized protein n=1 Tax=Collichthys lucidus TaxID=240159 RepID=A0A4U5VPN3_COLLU|nr:hypothetical protein D9C73_022444 [Collichthys lucidus]
MFKPVEESHVKVRVGRAAARGFKPELTIFTEASRAPSISNGPQTRHQPKLSSYSRFGPIEVRCCRVGGDGVDEIHEIKKKKRGDIQKASAPSPSQPSAFRIRGLTKRLFRMKAISAAVLSALFCTVVSASSKVKEEHRTAFFGEDVHIDVPPGNVGEVVFKPRTNRSAEVVLLRAGKVVNPGSYINTLGHLVLEDVQEKDEGLYVIKTTNSSNVLKHLNLIVRDCALEEVVKYGETYYIHLNHVEGPITLEFSCFDLNLIDGTGRENFKPLTTPQSVIRESLPVVLYNQTAVSAEEYVGRLSVSEKRVTLHSVKMTDEGSFTVLDRENKIRRRNCLNVREHQNFLHLSYGGNLKMKLYLHYSNLNIVYRRKSDNQDRLLVDQGVLVTPLDPMLEGRLTVEGSLLTMKKVNVADTGVFKVTDLSGFTVAHVYIEVDAYKLPPLTVAILSLVGLIAFMLLVCLLSCIYKMHRRNEKSKRLMLIAQQAGKGDGEAFRQVTPTRCVITVILRFSVMEEYLLILAHTLHPN